MLSFPDTLAIRAVFLDIDGTLLNPAHELTEFTITTVHALIESPDVAVYLLSARPPIGMKAVYTQLGLSTPVIAYNGAVIGKFSPNAPFDFIIESSLPIDGTSIETIYAIASRFAFTLCMYQADTIYTYDLENPFAQKEHRLTGCNLVPLDLPVLLAKWKELGLGAHKVQCLGDPATIQAFVAELSQQISSEIQVTRSGGQSYEITHIGASKARAVERISKQNEIALSHVMAVGDNFNDLETLIMVGVGVAMGNAPLEVKQAAKEVTGTNVDDGAAKAIRKHFPALDYSAYTTRQ